MIVFGHIQVHPLPLLVLMVLGLLTMQALALVLAPAPGRSLLAWSVGILGISAVYLRQPNAVLRFVRLFLPLAGMASVIYGLLTVQPLPVTGLAEAATTRRLLAATLALLLSLPRVLGALHEMRFPLWGEARVIDRVARGQTLGAIIYFTAAGRSYLRDRFGASPDEFLRIVRRRQSPMATGSHS